jgi:hypothetical protein
MVFVRAARRYRWRLAGGRLVASAGALRFIPNRLEARQPDAAWACTGEDAPTIRLRGRLWVVVETAQGDECFRVFRARSAVRALATALEPIS